MQLLILESDIRKEYKEMANLKNTEEIKGRSLAQDAVRRIKKNPLAVVCFFIVILYVLIALAAALNIGGIYDKAFENDFEHRYVKPFTTWAHIFGTDIFGRDTFIRAVVGTKVSLQLSLLTLIIQIPLGMVLGAFAGYFGGIIDDIIFFIMSVLQAIPGLLLLMSFILVMGRSFLVIAVAFAITGWIGLARTLRGLFFSAREFEYVMAAKALGANDSRIIFKHIIPNVFNYLVISVILNIVSIVMSEVTLAFLGLTVVGVPTWGIMISDSGLELAAGNWQNLIASGIVMFIFIMALNLFGDVLIDSIDPRLRNS